jgi:hypothetical protein
MFETVGSLCAICLGNEQDDLQGDRRKLSVQLIGVGVRGSAVSPRVDDFVKICIAGSWYAVSCEEFKRKVTWLDPTIIPSFLSSGDLRSPSLL